MLVSGATSYSPRSYFYVRTSSPSEPMITPVREAARALDPRVPILWVRTLEDVGAREVAPFTMLASGLTALGSVALALAALGLFGVLSFIVAQRRYEIGVRVALGARRIDVTWLVLRQALKLGAGGVVVGALIAVGTVTFLRALIHGLKPLDPLAFASVAVVMVLVALVASAIPARRAAAVDPMQALRTE
jgi:ABC-type antimicrobial peptide transport system permease subunit